MKRNTIQSFLLLLVLGIVATGCKPEELTLDPAPSKLEGINDTFTLNSVMQVDNNAVPGTLEKFDVSSAYIGTNPATISFNSGDFTFAFDPGTSLDFFGTGGTFAFDNDDYPTKLIMSSGGNQYDLVLNRTIRPQEEFLEVEMVRSCGNGAVSYQYKFQRN